MDIQSFVTGIQHIGIPTNDLHATTAFFERLGFRTVLRTRTAKEEVAFLQLRNIVIEAYENGKAAGVPGAIEHIALDVNDIEAAYAEIRSLGFEELEDGIQFLPFWERGVRYFTIMGPEGEKVEFNQKL